MLEKTRNVSCNCRIRLASMLSELVCIQISQEKQFCTISLHLRESVMSVANSSFYIIFSGFFFFETFL